MALRSTRIWILTIFGLLEAGEIVFSQRRKNSSNCHVLDKEGMNEFVLCHSFPFSHTITILNLTIFFLSNGDCKNATSLSCAISYENLSSLKSTFHHCKQIKFHNKWIAAFIKLSIKNHSVLNPEFCKNKQEVFLNQLWIAVLQGIS